MKLKYYQHKNNKSVICEVIRFSDKLEVARFGRWKWSNNVCTEIYTFKEVTKEFRNTFKNITHEEFNNEWGNKLQKA